MEYTSTEAAKLLRRLNEEHEALLAEENQSKMFHAALGEDMESVRPVYHYEEMQEKLAELERKIRIVKHSINLFNLTQEIPDFNMTIDQMLIYLPQLTAKKNKLNWMARRLPKQRENLGGFGGSSNVIDYQYTNYDIEKVKQDYAKVSEELAKAQTALDFINNTKKMEIEL